MPTADAPAAAELIVCETCGPTRPLPPELSPGARLFELLQKALAARANPVPLRLATVRCLWACDRRCAAQLRSADRDGYVLCDLEASEDCARALIEYAALYCASADGVVPYRSWPPSMRGHFLCRLPSVPDGPDPQGLPTTDSSPPQESE